MSRVAKNPIHLPKDVTVTISGCNITVKGGKGSLQREMSKDVKVDLKDNVIQVSMANANAANDAIAGTVRALLNNMVIGVSQGFEKKLDLIGVGYRAAVAGKTINLTLGFSHPVNFQIPTGITMQTPSQTEIIITGMDSQLVGQVAAQIRALRPPEPYKGKGVRYKDEKIILKETKKK